MTDPELAQAEVLAFLRDPATHGGVAPDYAIAADVSSQLDSMPKTFIMRIVSHQG